MTKFTYCDEISASKSLMIRSLIVKSFFSDFCIFGDSICDDVNLMKIALSKLSNDIGNTESTGGEIHFECGHSGAVLRFLALRVSRTPGRYILRGSERLFNRPQNELIPIFGQLGVSSKFNGNSLEITSKGWNLVVDGLQVNSDRSSQFASSLLLNAWGLRSPIHFNIGRQLVSAGYLRMTIQMLRKLGMRIEDNGSDFFIPANQKLKLKEYKIEPDMSSAFAVAAMAVVAGQALIKNFPTSSLQPDSIFVRILQSMGAAVLIKNGELYVEQSELSSGVNLNIESSPDLFPVLSVLCALAKTKSRISGISHLQFKESSRLDKSKELVEKMGGSMEFSMNEVIINPVKERVVSLEPKAFKTDNDHRMAMAAEVARRAGYNIIVDDMKVVSKSFPEFLSLPGVSL